MVLNADRAELLYIYAAATATESSGAHKDMVARERCGATVVATTAADKRNSSARVDAAHASQIIMHTHNV